MVLRRVAARDNGAAIILEAASIRRGQAIAVSHTMTPVGPGCTGNNLGGEVTTNTTPPTA